MAYSKYSSSLALLALAFLAIASLPNSQAVPGNIKFRVFVLGVVNCYVSPSQRAQVRATVTLSCDGGLTALVPPQETDPQTGEVLISFPGSINERGCGLYVKGPVAGCPVAKPGQIFEGYLTPMMSSYNVPALQQNQVLYSEVMIK